VWPWLVQMGSGRGGAYTYDWIENLFGLDMHSADAIMPEFQHLAVGDVLPLGPDGPGMRVEICDAESTPRSLRQRTIMLSGDADGLSTSQALSEGFVMDQHKHR
jgi:hypothetical protein